jgi:hypothetical protein
MTFTCTFFVCLFVFKAAIDDNVDTETRDCYTEGYRHADTNQNGKGGQNVE